MVGISVERFPYLSVQAARWLTIDNRPGDSLFFHYSGHGGRQIDRSGIEEDGYDETILPLDFETAGQIVDDEVSKPSSKRVRGQTSDYPSGCWSF